MDCLARDVLTLLASSPVALLFLAFSVPLVPETKPSSCPWLLRETVLFPDFPSLMALPSLLLTGTTSTSSSPPLLLPCAAGVEAAFVGGVLALAAFARVSGEADRVGVMCGLGFCLAVNE